jgi:glycosyltransferase involved in cell wall biosynthesis
MDKNRPIIWMIDSLGPGGAEQLMPTILRHLKDKEFNIRICALQVRLGNPIASELERIGLPVDLVPVPNLRHPLNLLRILRYLRLHQPRILHTQLEFSDILGTIAAKILGIPTVATLHTLDSFTNKKYSSWRLRLRWFVLRVFCNQIIAVSEKTRAHHLESGNLGSSKVMTLYNGVDISRFKGIDKAQITKTRQALNLTLDIPIIITVAVLREPKGIQNMIKALPAILEQVPDLHYLIVGDGNYGAALHELVSALTLEEHVTFAGHRTDIPALLACGDIFVLPTLKDALPTVLIEALAAEIPVVASNVGGVPEIIENGVDGLLVPPDDPSSLAKACLELLNNSELVRQMILEGSQIVQQRFSINAQIEKLSSLYQELSTSNEKQQ